MSTGDLPLKRRFDAAHQRAIDALTRKDFLALRHAIHEQCLIIAEHRELIATLRALEGESRPGAKARSVPPN